MKKIFIGFLIVVTSFPSISYAEAWERLPDGRVVIEIYGQRLAFKTDEATLDHINFSLDSDAFGISKVSPWLRDIVAQPDVTRKELERIRAENQKLIITDFLKLPVEGSGNPPVSEKPMHVRSYIYIWPRDVSRAFNKECASVTTEYKAPEGYTISSMRRTPHRKFPMTRVCYCLPAQNRKFEAENHLTICPNVNASGIGSFGHGEAANIAITSSFSSTMPLNERPHFSGNLVALDEAPYITQTTPEHWAEVDRQLHEYFSQMFIDLPEGAIQ